MRLLDRTISANILVKLSYRYFSVPAGNELVDLYVSQYDALDPGCRDIDMFVTRHAKDLRFEDMNARLLVGFGETPNETKLRCNSE